MTVDGFDSVSGTELCRLTLGLTWPHIQRAQDDSPRPKPPMPHPQEWSLTTELLCSGGELRRWMWARLLLFVLPTDRQHGGSCHLLSVVSHLHQLSLGRISLAHSVSETILPSSSWSANISSSVWLVILNFLGQSSRVLITRLCLRHVGSAARGVYIILVNSSKGKEKVVPVINSLGTAPWRRMGEPVEQEAGWAPKSVWALWRREISISPAGNRRPESERSVSLNMLRADSPFTCGFMAFCLIKNEKYFTSH